MTTPNPSNMVAVYDHRVDSLSHLQEVAMKAAGFAANVGSRLPWIIAFFLIAIFGFLYTIVAYLPIRLIRREIKRLINKLLKEVPSMDVRAAMELHAGVEDLCKKYDQMIARSSGFFVFIPLVAEFKKTVHQFRRAEEALFKKAYPEAGKPLTKEQEDELVNAFRSWQNEDEDVDYLVHR